MTNYGRVGTFPVHKEWPVGRETLGNYNRLYLEQAEASDEIVLDYMYNDSLGDHYAAFGALRR